MMRTKNFQAALLFMLPQLWSLNALASESVVVAELHSNPPSPCVAKDIEDMSSGIAIVPTGNTHDEVWGIMGAMASVFLSAGASLMTAKNIEVVYTAVFFENEPRNEIGIYAYKFKERIDKSMFSPRPELNGKFFVIDRNLLVLLWHEDYDKTARCFEAMDKLLTEKQ